MTSIVNIALNEYDIGVDDTDMSISVVQTDMGPTQLKDTEMKNPFFVPLTNQIEYEDRRKHKFIYVICMKDNYVDTPELKILYDQIVDKKQFLSVCKELAILKASPKMLNNNNFRMITKYISGEILSSIFNMNCENSWQEQHWESPQTQTGTQVKHIHNEELVLIMFELTDSIARTNIKLCDNTYDIEELSQMVQLVSQYYKTYKKMIMPQFADNLTKFNIAQFWCSRENCNLINMTNVFAERGFNYKKEKLEMFKKSIKNMNSQDKETIEKMDTLFQKNPQKHKNQAYLCYLNQLENEPSHDNEKNITNGKNDIEKTVNKTKGTTEFFDIYTALKRADKRTYFFNNNHDVDQKYMNEIFDLLTDDEEIYNVLNMFLVSKDYCHMIFSHEILNKIKPLMTKHIALYKYLFGYTWTSFILNESIMKSKTSKKDKFIFDIETASKLPYFPLCHDDLFQNPYIVIPVNSDVLNVKENILSFPCLVNGDQYYGVCSLEQFKYRMNLFMTGKSNIFPLKDIDWEHFAISGSIITACLQKKSPLFDLVTDDTKRDEEKWEIFFDHYYGESDIDLMCHAESISDYLNKVESVVASLDNNLNKGEKKTKIEHIKKMATFVSRQFFVERVDNFNEIYGTTYTPEQLCQLLDQTNEMNELHEYLHQIYSENKFKLNVEKKRNKKK